MSKIKWLAPRGTYQITRVEHTDSQCNYRDANGKSVIKDGQPVTVAATKITAYAGDVAVLTVTVAGNHSQTLANFRESMARRIQDLKGAWMGRTEASETALADARVAKENDPALSAQDRKALKDAYYNRVPHPSDY